MTEMDYHPAGVFEPTFWSISSHDFRHVERTGASAIGTNTVWVAGLAVYVPFVLPIAGTIYEWYIYNGTLTTAHNIDFGIYNLDFSKVQSLGSTAGGTTASVLVNTTNWSPDLTLAPGSYYMAYCDDSTRNITTSADPVGFYQASGIMEQTGLGSTLPSPAVPVAYTRAFLPEFGMNLRNVAI